MASSSLCLQTPHHPPLLQPPLAPGNHLPATTLRLTPTTPHRRALKCRSSAGLVHEDAAAVKVAVEEDPLQFYALNPKPVVLSKSRAPSPAVLEESEELVLKPAPKPRPRPQLKPESSQVANAEAPLDNGACWKSRTDRGKSRATQLLKKVASWPGRSSISKAEIGERSEHSLESLEGALGGAVKSSSGVGEESGSGSVNKVLIPTRPIKPIRKDSSQDRRANTASVGDRLLVSKGASTSTTDVDLAAMALPIIMPKPLLPKPKPLITAPAQLNSTPPSSKEAASRGKPVRKEPILKDIGAAPKQPTLKASQSTVKPKAIAVATAPASAIAPPKLGKGSSQKAKDDEEGRWKKSMSGSDGPKKRTSSSEEADDLSGLVFSGANSKASLRGGRKMTKASRKAARIEAARAAAPVRIDILEVGKQGISVPDLAQKLAVNDSEIVKTLFMKGIVTTVNQTLDEDTVKLVCKEYDVEVVEAGFLRVEDMARKTREFLDEDDLDNLLVRPPVVTIMGHVDHGKTSLLDFIMQSKLAASEAGGITQGIGAYRVLIPVDGKLQSCVFLDTPGHEAFSAMRARGARITDIAIIVVAADDGVRPQTQEAIAHAKAANVPIVIAINKIDKQGAEPDRVMQELASVGLLPEDWGGDVPMVQVSALNGQNVDILLETVMLVAEFQDLKANPNRSARGTVIESRLDKTKGAMATFLVQNGTLWKGAVVLCGQAYGKVRALLDDRGARIDQAGPSTAVQVFGLSSVPIAGDEFEVLDSLDMAREKAEQQATALRISRLAAQAGEGKVTLSSLAITVAESQEAGLERHRLNVLLKVDVQGSVEAIRAALEVLPQDTVNLRFLMQAPGNISASDVDLAIASEAIIIGFNVGVQSGVRAHAETKGVEIRLYRVIYELVDDIRSAMEGLLDPIQDKVPIGKAEVRATFNSGSGKVAGCMVTEGKLVKGCSVQIIRDRTIIHVASLDSLRRVKELAKEVIAGLECGVAVNGFTEWLQGDIIDAFNLIARKKTLEDASATAATVATAAANSSKSL